MFRHGLTRLRAVEIAILCATAGVVLGLVTRTLVFGSHAGRWVYPFVQGATPGAILLALLFGLGLPLAYEWSARRADSRAAAVVAAWMLLGCCFQVAVRELYPIPMRRIVAGAGCNSFFTATLQHAPIDVITKYEAVAPTLPLHAQANMPGKLFVYYFLERFSRDPETLAFAIVALSTFGGALVFAVARRLFHDGRVATLAMVLSLIFPAMVAFQPLLNTVTPIFVLLSIWLWTVYLDRRQDRYLWLLGASLYLQMFVDPLTFVLGIVFLGVLAERLASGACSAAMLWRSAVIPVAGFLGVHAVMRFTAGFDIVSVFVSLWKAAAAFNQAADRPYAVWVVHNLKDFFLGVGAAPSLAALLAPALICRAMIRARRADRRSGMLQRCLSAPGSAFTASFFLCLLVIDLAGINRGEVTRLWIFLGVFLQMAAAQSLVAFLGGAAARISIGALAVQTALTASMVGFILC